MVEIAKKEGITLIVEQALTVINDKRREEKKKKRTILRPKILLLQKLQLFAVDRFLHIIYNVISKGLFRHSTGNGGRSKHTEGSSS